MSNLYWLSEDQMVRLRPFFPKSHGKPRVDDRRVLSGIIFINRNFEEGGCQVARVCAKSIPRSTTKKFLVARLRLGFKPQERAIDPDGG